ncbi:hypothetical protein SKAU_G00345540 [Synaphobranchus kaupii]|uniref:Uncharacterized protein n=1 Tax=Synaphobranchus kaupii TaxID=118154 RepID=A0A9Q1EJE2_SYNKA|nr:hypothetical protein SKAU_G00345540 [Synaphobranchus kaupii]
MCAVCEESHVRTAPLRGHMISTPLGTSVYRARVCASEPLCSDWLEERRRRVCLSRPHCACESFTIVPAEHANPVYPAERQGRAAVRGRDRPRAPPRLESPGADVWAPP